jgi:hypothetical protein
MFNESISELTVVFLCYVFFSQRTHKNAATNKWIEIGKVVAFGFFVCLFYFIYLFTFGSTGY